jgi:hypothetical protein
MKHLLSVICVGLSAAAFSQATNTSPWPSNGAVGIGVTSPGDILEVRNPPTTQLDKGVLIYNQSGYAPRITLDASSSGNMTGSWMIQTNGTSNSPGNGEFIIHDAINQKTRLLISKATGNVGISTDNPGAKLEVYEPSALGGSQNNYKLLEKVSGNYGSTASKYSRCLWLTRFDNGSSFSTVNLLDGIAIDASYLTPGSSTASDRPKTWWSRDAYNDVQQWGNQDYLHMFLDQGFLALHLLNPGATPRLNPTTPLIALSNRGRFQVEESDGRHPAIYAKTAHGTGYGYAIVASVNHDKTHALKVVHRDFHGTGQSQESFGVYGDGQTVISTKCADAFLIQDPTQQGDNINFKVKKTGFVFCRELQVMVTTFPDYVFENKYPLMPLDKLGDFIKTNKHLPGFEKGQFYVDNGIRTSEMFVKQQEKIEELTLYIIDLQRQVTQLQQKVGDK